MTCQALWNQDGAWATILLLPMQGVLEWCLPKATEGPTVRAPSRLRLAYEIAV
jgi:hypothetical protein